MNSQTSKSRRGRVIVLIIIGVIAILLGSFATVLYMNHAQDPDTEKLSSTTVQNTKSGSTDSTATNSDSTSTNQTTPGQYIDYSDTAIANTPGTKLLFFHAPWCPQCRALDASIKASTIPTGVTIMKVDYDSHQDLRAKYGVTLQTTVVRVDDDGNKVDSYTAYNSPTFTSVEENLL